MQTLRNLYVIFTSDGAAGGTLARVLAAGSSSGISLGTTTKRSSLSRSVTPNHLGLSSLTLSSIGGVTGSTTQVMEFSFSNHHFFLTTYFFCAQDGKGQAENLAQDMSGLMHDFDVVSRIASLIVTLKGRYEVFRNLPLNYFSFLMQFFQNLTTAVTTQIMAEIQSSIRQKDEEMSWLDACCLHFSIKGKTKTETYSFQTKDPNVKKEWIVGEFFPFKHTQKSILFFHITKLKNHSK